MAATYEGKIMARSPFYITATGAAYITSAELKIYIWSGALASKPSVTYTMEKVAKTATETNIVFEISHVIRDYFEHSSTGYDDTNYVDCLHVEIELDVVQTTAPDDATVNYRYFAFDGYGEFSDGVNYEGEYSITNFYTNSTTGYLPVYINSDGGNKVIKYSLAPPSETDYTTEEVSTDSTDKIQYITIGGYNEVKVYNDTTLIETFYFEETEECKYTIREVKFYDKLGLLQIVSLFKKSTENFEVSHDYYNSMIGGVVSDVFTYDVKDHERRTLNTTGKVKETINTGFVDESMNEVYKQLLASEFVWVDDIPCVVTTKNIAYKTQLNDKLVEYTFEFEHANNFINEV